MKSNKKSIPLSVPVIQGNEWQYIKECLDTGWVSSVGSYVERFEKGVREYIGTKYSVAVVNGTSALHLSLLICGVQPEDEVIVPTLTFVAPVNAVRYCAAHPIFIDSDMESLCIDVAKVAYFIEKESFRDKDGFTYNRKTKRRIKAIVPVHVFGHPADVGPLLALSAKHNISVIEDASESLGSKYKGRMTGTFGEIGVFSFNGNKIITTGGGGMVVTNNKSFADKIRHLSTQAKSDPFEYDHDEIGYNYRLTNLQAAMGVAQMEKLDEYLIIKRANAGLYKKLLSDVGEVKFLWEKPWASSNCWFYTIKIPRGQKGLLMKHLLSKNIQVRPIWKLIHTLPMYKNSQAYSTEKAVEAYDTCINLPCSVNLDKKEIEYVADVIRGYFNGL